MNFNGPTIEIVGFSCFMGLWERGNKTLTLPSPGNTGRGEEEEMERCHGHGTNLRYDVERWRAIPGRHAHARGEGGDRAPSGIDGGGHHRGRVPDQLGWRLRVGAGRGGGDHQGGGLRVVAVHAEG